MFFTVKTFSYEKFGQKSGCVSYTGTYYIRLNMVIRNFYLAYKRKWLKILPVHCIKSGLKQSITHTSGVIFFLQSFHLLPDHFFSFYELGVKKVCAQNFYLLISFNNQSSKSFSAPSKSPHARLMSCRYILGI